MSKMDCSKREFTKRDYSQIEITRIQISKVCKQLELVLLEKNRRYGNSALEPMGIFTKHANPAIETKAVCGMLFRLDDKLARIANAGVLKKNDTFDIMGYLVLLCVKKGWISFEELLD